MGQIVLGVVYGVLPPKGFSLYADAADTTGLMPDFVECTRLRESDVDALAYDEDGQVFGYWVVPRVGAAGYGPALRPVDIINPAQYVARLSNSKAGRRAAYVWDLFAKFTAQRGLVLPDPSFYLAEHEVA